MGVCFSYPSFHNLILLKKNLPYDPYGRNLNKKLPQAYCYMTDVLIILFATKTSTYSNLNVVVII